MQSMTGFGRAEGKVGDLTYLIECRSVNHRFCEIRFRMPSQFNSFELTLTERLKTFFERGSFEIWIKPKQQSLSVPGNTRYVIDEKALSSFVDACKWIGEVHKIATTPSIEAIIQTGKILYPVEDSAQESSEDLFKLFDLAMLSLKGMRGSEGMKLQGVLGAALDEIDQQVTRCRPLAAGLADTVREKLMQRIGQWQLGSPVDRQRLEWEVAFYADRADVHEELDRLNMHVVEFRKLLASASGSGRRLDFLTQEMHREVNTLSSKAGHYDLTRAAVEAKSIVERLREQVQNVE